MFKKISTLLICFVMAAACIGCGEKDDSSKKESSETEATTEAPTEVDEAALKAEEELKAEEDALNSQKAAEDALKAEEDAQKAEEDALKAEEDAQKAEALEIDTDVVVAAIMDHTWNTGYIADADGNVSTIADFCELGGTDPAEMEMSMTFLEDGIVNASSQGNEESATYTVDGALITMANDDDTTMELIYEQTSNMLYLDLLGTGNFFLVFE